ncbi:hypothetical protein KHA93_19400 [Bacillus sp. FJAT-49732]|uniref:Uncharacterized protein n=1 Tax=Lederbergia citrisecunda TaxID=2833583 RepID=A0A942TR20_9BACI|nr:hypothetical protein [Lederbergia citrisecunda]MBS4201773.1 hypothetical protein [Lederbergia citrisecunda]
MKILSILFLIPGTIATFIGILPFIFAYPYCDRCPNSGQSNLWELILMTSYEGKGWYLVNGIVLLMLSILTFFKQRKA